MLLEGYLNEEFVLTHVTNVIALLRECNIALRWYMLHSAALPPCKTNSFKIFSYCSIILCSCGEQQEMQKCPRADASGIKIQHKGHVSTIAEYIST